MHRDFGLFLCFLRPYVISYDLAPTPLLTSYEVSLIIDFVLLRFHLLVTVPIL